jgi:hypothetical protein
MSQTDSTHAARTSETLVNFYQTTWRYNPEDSHLCTHCRENLKSYMYLCVCLSPSVTFEPFMKLESDPTIIPFNSLSTVAMKTLKVREILRFEVLLAVKISTRETSDFFL